MSFIEMQVRTDSLLGVFREGLREALMVVVAEEWSAFGQTLLIDRVEVLAGTDDSKLVPPTTQLAPVRWEDDAHSIGIDPLSSFPTAMVDAAPVIVEQNLHIDPVLLLGRGTDEPELVRLPQVTASFSIEITAAAVEGPPAASPGSPPGVPTFEVSAFAASLEPMPQVALGLQQNLIDAISAAAGALSKTVPMPVDAPVLDLGRLDFGNAGLTAIGGGARVALLLQAGLATEDFTQRRWESFYAGQAPDLTASSLGGAAGPARSWGVRVDGELLTWPLRDDLEYELKHPDPSVWLANRGVTVGLGPAGDHLQLTADAYFDVATHVLGTEIELELHAQTELQASEPGRLTATTLLVASADVPFDTALIAAAGLAVVGSTLTAVVPGMVLAVPALGLLAVACVGSLWAVQVDAITHALEPDCSSSPVYVAPGSLAAELEMQCSVDTAKSLSFLTRHAELELTALFATRADEAVAAGTLTPLPPLPRPAWEVEAGNWIWRAPEVHCADTGDGGAIIESFRANPSSARCYLLASVVTEPAAGGPPPEPAVLIDAYVASSDDGLASVTTLDATTVRVSVRYDTAFMVSPKPVSVLFHTTAGVQLVTLPPPPPFDLDALTGQMMTAIGKCQEQMDSFFKEFGRYNVKWAGDPAPEVSVAHFSDVLVTGLPAGERLRLTGATGEPVVEAEVGPDGSARLAYLDLDAAGDDELALERQASQPRDQADRGAATGALRIVQAQLTQRALLRLPSPARHLAAGTVGGRQILSVARADATDLFDLSRPDAPVLVASLAGREHSGTAVVGDAIVAWGARGVEAIDLSGAPPSVASARSLLDVPTRQAAVARGTLFALAGGRLLAVDLATGGRTADLSVDGDLLVAARGALAIAGAGWLEVRAADDPGRRLGGIEIDCRALRFASLSSISRTVIAGTAEGDVAIDLGDLRAPRRSARYAESAAHATAVASGRTVVMPNEGGDAVAILSRRRRTT